MTEPRIGAPIGPRIGVVAIGRNEGERLRRCLASLSGTGLPVVYVDSASTDGSPALAAGMGAEVAAIDPAQGFTAGKARNLGFATLLARHPDLDLVQFVDGDCEIDPAWIPAAAARLAEAPRLAAVAGRRRERFPDASPFNRLCDMEWNTPPGPAAAVGGDALYRVAAFAGAGGFDPSLICGEEPDLCLRLARAGWSVERLDREMTLHDAAMTRWSQWVRRTRRSGWAFAEGADRHGAGPERYNRRQARSILLWGAAVPAAIVLLALLAAALAAAGAAAWPLPAAAAALGLAAYPAMALRVARGRRRARGDAPADARLYGAFAMLGKVPQLLGMLDYRATKRRGGTARIIEYKSPEGGGAA